MFPGRRGTNWSRGYKTYRRFPRQPAMRLCHESIYQAVYQPGSLLPRPVTWDQGTEMARHLAISRSLGAPACFCDSRSPWQRGSNENTNGFLRGYSPKGTDLSVQGQRPPGPPRPSVA